ncbi:MAG: YegS/Rv2252/BmrU family lipid kinase [Rikenellaceae bacterium]
MKRALFLYNKNAGRGKAEKQAKEIAQILTDGGYDTTFEALDFKRDQIAECGEEVDLVVVAGGDGSVNYVVNLIKQSGSKAAIGIIPAGTANDFAYALGMQRNPLKAARQIASGVDDNVDCGYVNGLYFVNIFSFGLFTTTSQRTPDSQKRTIGKFAYIIEGVKELERIHNMELRINADNESFTINALMTLVLNGRTAGGFRLARNASVTDGCLDCLILENRTFMGSLIAAFRYLLGGNPKAIRHIKARNIQILSSENEPTDADGQRGVDFPLNIECLARELKVIIPSKTL